MCQLLTIVQLANHRDPSRREASSAQNALLANHRDPSRGEATRSNVMIRPWKAGNYFRNR